MRDPLTVLKFFSHQPTSVLICQLELTSEKEEEAFREFLCSRIGIKHSPRK